MEVLVTGGAGFIGSAVVRALLARGDGVRVLDDLSGGHESNLLGLLATGDPRFRVGDVRDPALCAEACSGVDAVVHLAAQVSVPRSVEDPRTSHDVNVAGTLNLLAACRTEHARRFVLASSSAVYGDGAEPVKTERLAPSPLSPYAADKLAAEAYARAFWGTCGLETISLRFFNVFGPRQDPESMYAAVVPIFAAALARGEPPTIHGDGQQTRDFVFVDDVAHAILRALDAPAEACGKSYNIGRGESVSVLELFEMIRAAVGTRARDIEPILGPPRRGDVRHSRSSIASAREAIDFEPRTSLAQGLADTVAWMLTTGS